MKNSVVNNAVYDSLGERWYVAQDDPIALLRAEASFRNPWVLQILQRQFGQNPEDCQVLDVGCGGGFLSNALAQAGCQVTGVDLSEQSLHVAKKYDVTKNVTYLKADAYALPFEPSSFDAVCVMDFLEHIENPLQVIKEAARVLKPGGLFFYYTFNRSFLSWLIVIKGVEWVVKNVPRNLHVYRLFLKPAEVAAMCSANDMKIAEVCGVRPVVWSKPFWNLLRTGEVSESFAFEFTKSLQMAYLGYAIKAPLN
jgi:2-polyprenyl-6-hydroxyphenyl methylase/3-demethylubiquinone-9 3-methyltransferase